MIWKTRACRRWIYHDQEFFEVEKQAIFRNSWQVVCHVNDIPKVGDFHTFEFFGESVVVVRAEEGVRAFHNVCRHRAARLLDGPTGNCGKRITCPYHAWTYGLDGRLVALSRETFKNLDTSQARPRRVRARDLHGFVFVRFAPGLPSVREMLAPYGTRSPPIASRSWCRWAGCPCDRAR